MAIPASSDGQEVLRRGVVQAQSNSNWTAFVFTGGSPTTGTNSYTVPANHIITMLSIIWCETAGNAELLQLNTGAGYYLANMPLPAYGTFIWDDRICLKGGEQLQTLTASGADVDVLYSYLDQDWS